MWLDADARFSIADADVARRLAMRAAARSRKRPPKPKPNENCSQCNTTSTCPGTPLDTFCSPNNQANCGCRLA